MDGLLTGSFQSKRLRSLLLGACAALAVLPAAAAIGQDGFGQEFDQSLHDLLPEHIKQSGRIVAAGNFDNPPSLYADVNDPTRPLGVAPDLSAAIGEILGVEFQWQNVAWPGQLPGLDAGTFDVLWGQISVTAQREREVLDLVPWSQEILSFLTLKENAGEFSDQWADACGKTLSVALGSIYVSVLADVNARFCEGAGLPAVVINEYQGNEETAIRSGQVDAALDHYTVLKRIAEELPDVYEAIPLSLEQSYEVYPGMAGIGAKKENAGLSQAIAGALDILYQNGTWAQILEDNDSDNMPDARLIRVNALTGTPAGEVSPQ